MYCLIFWRLPKFTKIKRCFVDCKFETDSWCTFWWIFKDFSLSFPQVLFDDITSCEEKIHQRASIVDPSTGDDKWIDLFKNENIKKNAQVFNLHTWTITICLKFLYRKCAYKFKYLYHFSGVRKQTKKEQIYRRS